jgi:transcriptional regulator GlxA family with amidase domain
LANAFPARKKFMQRLMLYGADAIAGGMAAQHAAKPLAAMAGMSVAAFYRHFRALTAMTPIQYQKRLRLIKARRLLLFEPRDAAAIRRL